MRNAIPLLVPALVVCLGALSAPATVITSDLTADVVGSVSTGDGLVTLNAYSVLDPETAGTFSSAGFIGVAGGNNGSAVDDIDGDPATLGDREAIDLLLDATVGLSQMVVQWTRASGAEPTDGVQIAGFLSDPGASLSTGTGGVSYDAGSVYVNLAWTGGTLTTLDLGNLGASAGQTLRITTNDSDETGPQVAIVSLSYDVIPEPSTLALLAVGTGLAAVARRRR